MYSIILEKKESCRIRNRHEFIVRDDYITVRKILTKEKNRVLLKWVESFIFIKNVSGPVATKSSDFFYTLRKCSRYDSCKVII